MFRFFLFISLFVLLPVFSQETTEEPFLQFTTDTDTTDSGSSLTTESAVVATDDTTESLLEQTTEQPLGELTDSTNQTPSSNEYTTEDRNFTKTTQQITSTLTTPCSHTCPPSITPEMLERTKREIIDSISLAISRQISDRLDAIEERLSTFSCSSTQSLTPLRLSWQIYENLHIPLTGWLRVFDQPYSHRTRTDDLNQISGICHNDVLVGASFNKSISLAAVGPASILTLNTTWNLPQQLGQVYWYRTIGKSFGFSPLPTVRQTSGDNEDLNSPLRLSWIVDQNVGGYRAGSTRSLMDNSLWRKVIHCN